eukprot:7574420-Alexandrium_andersonii.AAC.1
MPRSFKACLGSRCPARRAMRHHLDEKRIPDFARSKLSARDKLGRAQAGIEVLCIGANSCPSRCLGEVLEAPCIACENCPSLAEHQTLYPKARERGARKHRDTCSLQ